MGKESPGLWVDVIFCVPELSEAVGATHVIVPVSSPMSVTPGCFLGHAWMFGSSISVSKKINK